MNETGTMHLRRLVGGRERRCRMGRLVKALTVTAVLAVSLLATGSSASADGGNKGKALPAAASFRVTWDAPGGLNAGSAATLRSITWE